MNIKTMRLADLRPAGYNPRKDLQPGDPEYEKLKRSIGTFGYVEPIVWNERTQSVVGGHQRLKVLLDLGTEEESVVVVDLHPNDEKALNIALNKISGDWDMPRLKDLLENLDTGAYDLTLTGFDLDAVEDIMTQYHMPDDEEDGDDFDVDAEEEAVGETPFTERGDVYILGGKHRLLCGDATSAEDFAVLMDGHPARLTVTDPPYNVDYTGKTKDALKIENDKQSDSAFQTFLLAAFTNIREAMKPGAAVYIFHADSEGLNFRQAFEGAGFETRQCLVWVKNSLVLGRQDYQWKHEPILYGWKEGEAHYFIDDRSQTTVINHDKPTRNGDHPTMKPVSLVGRFVSNSSKAGWIVLDPFGGSGSTLIACEQLKRTCYTMELDPRFCDVIVRRYIAWCRDHGKSVDVALTRGDEPTPHPFAETDE
jgi:DNA modification methylase